MHQVYNEYFDSPNRYISHSALTQFLGEWESALSVLMVLENMPTQSSHDKRRIMNFLFQGIVSKHWMDLMRENHSKICEVMVQVGHLKLHITKSTMWWLILLWMFVSRLYGDLYFSQILLLNLRKGICELIPIVTCKDHMSWHRAWGSVLPWCVGSVPRLLQRIHDHLFSILLCSKWRAFTTAWVAWGAYHHSQGIWLRWDLTMPSKDGFCLGLVHVCPSSSQERHWHSFK